MIPPPAPRADDQLVTPEGVALALDPAGVGSRSVALLLDAIVQFVALFGLLMLLAIASGFISGWVALTIAFLAVFTVLFGYPVLLETLWRGRTLGKAALGLRVVTVEGAPVRMRHAAIRAALGLVDFLGTGGAAAVVSALATARNQRLGDLVAGTVVVHERRRRAHATSFFAPPEAASAAATVDVAGLDRDDYGLVRSFLLRAPSMSAHARAELATQIADGIAVRLGQPRPPELDAATWLAAVAARVQANAVPTHAQRWEPPSTWAPPTTPPVFAPAVPAPPPAPVPTPEPPPPAPEEPTAPPDWAPLT